MPVAFALAMASAWVTTRLGLQPVFGGFLAGLAMRPRNGVPDADVVHSLTTLMTGPLLSVIRPTRASLPAETVRLSNM